MARKNRTPQVDVTAPPPVEDPKRADYKPAEAKLRRAQRGEEQPNEEEAKKDHVYGIASRQRWGGDTDITQLHRDSRAIDGEPNSGGGEEEEEEEEEETTASDLTVAQLREALEGAQVEIPAGSKKADLVALYEEHNLGGDAE